MAHIHDVLDSDLHFVIDPLTRQLRIDTEVEKESKMVVIQYDHNSERVTFEIPKEVDGHDMSTCNVVQVHYLNVSADGRTTASGVYEVEDLQVSGDVVVGTWLISQNATQLAGTLNFLIRFVCVTGNSPDYVWNTAIYQSIAVSSGLYNGEEIVVEYADILEQWRDQLLEAEVTDERLAAVVADYMGENGPVKIDATLTHSGQAADAKAVGDTIEVLRTEVRNNSQNNSSGNTVSIFAGKTASFYGDSLTEANRHYTKGYHSWIKDLLGLTSYKNYGVSGYKVSDVYNKVNSVNDTADIIFVMCGVNDQTFSVPLGTFGDNTVSTTYGSLELLCGLLKSKYPTKIIVFITPHFQTGLPHNNGITSYEISKAVREVCEKHCIVVYDNFVKSGICNTNLSYWTTDKCHWNDKAHEMVGRNLARFVDDTFCYLYGMVVTKTLTSITATFDRGSNVIYETDSLDTLKQYLTVTANYSDGSNETVTGYVLSGTLIAGTSTITVTYGGKIATFAISVKASETPTYSVTNNLTNVTNSNTVTKVNEGASYTATLTAVSGYEIDTVTVTMGGNNITATAYSNGTVSIASVTGNVVITATAVETATYVPEEFIGKTFTVLAGENGYGQFHFTALGVNPGNLAGNNVTIELEGSNVVNIQNRSGAATSNVFGDNSGEVNNSQFSGYCGTPSASTIVQNGKLTARASGNGTALDTKYVKYVLLFYVDDFPASFTIDNLKVTVGGVEQEILKVGTFFSGETYELSGKGTEDNGTTVQKTLTGISATYTGRNVTVGRDVSTLTGVNVVASYSDGSTATVTGYTLSGTIEEGINTIMVSYEGFTATFTVTGVGEVRYDSEWVDKTFIMTATSNAALSVFNFTALLPSASYVSGTKVAATLNISDHDDVSSLNSGSGCFYDTTGELGNSGFAGGAASPSYGSTHTIDDNGNMVLSIQTTLNKSYDGYLKVVIPINRKKDFPLSFVIKGVEVTLDGVPTEILDIGSFFTGETCTIT